MKLRYIKKNHEGVREAKFHCNGKLLCDGSTFTHPLFLFDANETKQDTSIYQITCCHLCKCQEYTQRDEELLEGVEEPTNDNQKTQ